MSAPEHKHQYKGVIAWFVYNPVAANLLMFAIIAFGLYAVWKKIPLEAFPEFESDVVNISVAYPGATPAEVEQGVILRVEDAITDLPSIDRVYASAREGNAQVRVEVRKNYAIDKALNEIKTRVEGISNFPAEVERPVVEQQIRIRDVITVVVAQAGKDEQALRRTAEAIRDEVRSLPDITQVSMGGIRPWEITISVPETALRQYNLTLNSIAQAIRNSSSDIPGGTIKTEAGDILVRALGQAYRKNDFATISILTTANGARLRLGDIATIVDGFNEDPLYSQFDGKNAAFINVARVGEQSVLKVANTIKEYVAERSQTLPEGIDLSYWRDSSKSVEARLATLTNSMVQGMFLVTLLLALFLRPSVAFWVSLGIPISFLGALAVMPFLGITLNLISMFAFIIVLGIVVDDAIVTGENVYSHLQEHENPVRAAIVGTQEVSVPVTFGVLTTVAAFMPLLMLEGNRGPVFAQIPKIVIPVLLFSLLESKFILPAHLRHIKPRDPQKIGFFSRIQWGIARSLEYFIEKIYRPLLEFSLNWRYSTVSLFIAILVVAIAFILSGRFQYTFFPRIESEVVSATLQMPEGTPVEVTARHIQTMTHSAEQLRDKYIDPSTGQSIIRHILVTVGATGSRPRETNGQSNIGSVVFETIPPEQRSLAVSTREMTNEWRRLIGPVPGAQELSFRAEIGRGGEPIDVQLAGTDFTTLNEVAELVKAKLNEYDGLFDIKNNFEAGKTEVQLRIRPEAEALGLTLRDLGTQVRYAVFGLEVQRLLRDQSEVKVMLRYPRDERYSLASLENLYIRTPSGAEVPLREVAEIELGQGASLISRVDNKRIINITADLNKDKVDANKVVSDLKAWLPTVLKDYPGIRFDMEGEQREQAQFGQSLLLGFVFALISIYVLLAIPFKSYTQPLMVMSIIPFSLIGALAGHGLMGIGLSISSIMGYLALVGVVVNDSLVLVDHINKQVAEEVPVKKAIRISGGARFRPILLTSLTTFAGLAPLIFDKSTQAQFLIPMAVSLGFGVLFGTFLTLFLIPSFYLITDDLKRIANAIGRVLVRWW